MKKLLFVLVLVVAVKYAVFTSCTNCYSLFEVNIPYGVSQEEYKGTAVICPNCGVTLIFDGMFSSPAKRGE